MDANSWRPSGSGVSTQLRPVQVRQQRIYLGVSRKRPSVGSRPNAAEDMHKSAPPCYVGQYGVRSVAHPLRLDYMRLKKQLKLEECVI